MTQKYIPLWTTSFTQSDHNKYTRLRMTSLGQDFVIHFNDNIKTETIKRTSTNDWVECIDHPGFLEVYKQLIIDTWEESEKTGQFEWKSRVPEYLYRAQVLLSDLNETVLSSNKDEYITLKQLQCEYIEYINWLKQQ